jgi:hypothetical protein
LLPPLPGRCVTMGLFMFNGGREPPFGDPKLCQPLLVLGRALLSGVGREALPELPFSVGRSAVLPVGREALGFEDPEADGRVSVFPPRAGELFVGRSFVAPRLPSAPALLRELKDPDPSRAPLAGLAPP